MLLTQQSATAGRSNILPSRTSSRTQENNSWPKRQRGSDKPVNNHISWKTSTVSKDATMESTPRDARCPRLATRFVKMTCWISLQVNQFTCRWITTRNERDKSWVYTVITITIQHRHVSSKCSFVRDKRARPLRSTKTHRDVDKRSDAKHLQTQFYRHGTTYLESALFWQDCLGSERKWYHRGLTGWVSW